jgi:hypothetical protein
MRYLSNRERASDYEVEGWLQDKLQLTPYQRSILRDQEILRFSKFRFFKYRPKVSTSLWWRLTILLWPVVWVLLLLGLPFTMIVRGRWGYSEPFLQKFIRPWAYKIGL